MVESYRDLTVWQKAMDLAEMVISLTSKLPREQTYGMIAELETQLILCGRAKFLSDGEVTRALSLSDEVGKMLRGVQRGLKEKLN